MRTIRSAKAALARLTMDSIASDNSPTESVSHQARNFNAIVTVATAMDARSRTCGVSDWGDHALMRRIVRAESAPMRTLLVRQGAWIAAGLLLAGAGCVALARTELARARD